MGWWAKGPIKDPARARARAEGGGGGGEVRPAGAAQRLDAAALIRGNEQHASSNVSRCAGRLAAGVVLGHGAALAADAAKGKAAFMKNGCWQCHGTRRAGLGDHQRRQGAGARSDAVRRRSRPSCARPTRRCRPTARRSCRTRTSPTCTPICRRSRSRRTTRAFRCSASSASRNQKAPGAIRGLFVFEAGASRSRCASSRWLFQPIPFSGVVLDCVWKT